MANSKSYSAADFLDPKFAEDFARQLDEAKIPFQTLIKNISDGIAKVRQFTGNLPESEKELQQWQAILKTCTKGSQDYFYAVQQINLITKANKETVEGASSAWKQLNIEVGKLANAAREAGAVYGAQSAQFKKANDELNAARVRVDSVNQAMGNFQRNVGNYSNGISNALGKLSAGSHVIRAMGEAFGVQIGPLREYVMGLHGLAHLLEENTDKMKLNSAAIEANTTAMEGRNDIEDETLLQEHAIIDVNQAVAVSNEEVGASWLAMLGPLEWIVVAIAAVGAALGIGLAAWSSHIKNINEYSKAVDGSIIRDKKQRDEYNKTINELAELADSYDVLIGKMTQYEAARNKISRGLATDTRDLENEKAKNMQDNIRFLTRLGDFFTGGEAGLVDARKKELNDQYNKLFTELNEIAQAKINEEIVKEVDAQMKSNAERKKLVLGYMEEIEQSRNELQIRDEKRARNEVEIERKYTDAKLQVDIDYYQQKSIRNDGLDEEDTNKLKNLLDEQNKVNEVAANKQEGITREFRQKEIDAQLEFNEKRAKLSENALNEEEARYKKATADIILELRHRFGEEYMLHQQSKDALAENEAEHGENLRKIATGQYDKQAEAQQQLDATIRNPTEREWTEDIHRFEKQVHDLEAWKTNLIALNGKLTESEQLWYNTEMKAYIQGNINAMTAVNNKTTLFEASNTANASGEVARHAKAMGEGNFGGAPLQDLQNKEDQAAADQQTKEKDDLIASWGLDPKSTEDLKTLTIDQQNALANIDKKYEDEKLERHQQNLIKEKEMEAQINEQMLTALSETVRARNQAIQEGLAAQQEQYSNDAKIQAELAGEGRANSLAAVQAAEARNEAAQQASARKAAEEQEAIELAKLVIQLDLAYVKGGMNGQQALQKALKDALLTKAAVSGLMAAFYEGTADTGAGGNIDSKGGFLGILHPREAVIPADKNKQAPGLAKAWIGGNLNQWMMENYPKISMPNMGPSETAQLAIISAKLDKLDEVNSTIKNQPVIEYLFEDETKAVRKVRENGNEKIVVHHKQVRTSKPHAGI